MVFGFFERPSWSPAQIPDLHGRVAIVTGGNSGIGYVTALELSRHGAKTYLACRDPTRAATAIEKIKKTVPESDPQFLKFDLTSLNSANAAAEHFLSLESRLDILVNNAGISCLPYQLSEDGIEIQACNGTGHYAFTIPLLSILEKTAKEPDSHVRIINVASNGHRAVWKPDFSSLETLNQKSWGSLGRYGNSKLSNILFTNELQKHLENSKIMCLSIHPGAVHTAIATNGLFITYPILKLLAWLQPLILLTAEDGAITQLYAATDLEVESKNLKAAFLVPFGKVEEPSKLAKDEEGTLGGQFWNLCEALVREKVKKA